MVIRTTCCCGFEIGRGCKLIGILYSILNVVGIIFDVYCIAVVASSYPTGVEPGSKMTLEELQTLHRGVLAVLIVWLIYPVLDLASNMLLIFSVYKEYLVGCKIWIWFHALEVVIYAILVYLLVNFVYPGNGLAIVYFELGYLLICIPAIYFIAVVRRFVNKVEDRKFWDEDDKGESNKDGLLMQTR